MLVEDKNKLTGNARYEGFAIDLADALSSKIGFNYTFKLVDDDQVLLHNFLHSDLENQSMVKRSHLEIGMGCWERLWMEPPTFV